MLVSFYKKMMMVVLGMLLLIGSLSGHALFAESTAYAAGADNWSQVSKTGIEGAQYAALLNANETLYIAYSDSNQGGKATVKKFNGTDWESVGDEGFSESQIRYPSLAVSNGEPYVAYIHNESVVVKKYEGGSWKTVGTETDASNDVLPSLISINGKIYLAYARKVKVGMASVNATVKEFQGNDWKLVLNASNSGKAIANIALANQNGKLHVANVWPNLTQVLSLNGTDGTNPWWNFEEDYSISSRNAIAFTASDYNDSTYMAIVDQNDKSIVVNRDTPGKKSSPLSSPGTSENDEGTHVLSMTVKDDIPYVAYIDSNSGKVAVKKYIGQWETVGNEAFTPSGTNAVSLTIVDDIPYVVVTDSSGDSTVYKMVSTPPPVLSTTATSSDVANAIDITFADDPIWRQNITAVKDETNKQLAYTAAPGKITIQANELTAVGHTITVSATGYVDTSVKIVSNNADLNSISLNSGALNETFDSAKTDYTQNVGQSVTNLTVTPTAADSKSTITVNGSPVSSGQASGAISLQMGSNPITIIVTAQTGTTKTYNIQVNKMLVSTNANLSGLTVSSGSLNEAFDPNTTSYTHDAGSGTTSLKVTPTTADSKSTVTVNGTAVESGQESAEISLTTGSNMITIIVTAEDSTVTKTYTVQVSKASTSTNADLSNVVLSSGPFHEAFHPAKTNYTQRVGNSTASLTVTPTVADSNATVTVNGSLVKSGQASAAISLKTGTNEITIVVTAEDGTTKTYTIVVTRQSVTPPPPPPSYYPVTDVSLDQEELYLTEGGETAELRATITPAYATNQSVKWSSSDPEVASVDDQGVVTPLAPGKATITVTTVDQGKTATIRVKVAREGEKRLVELRVSDKNILLKPGKSSSIKLYAIYADDTKEDITKNKDVRYETSEEEVATATKGVIKAGKKKGEATITISYQDEELTIPVVVSDVYVSKLKLTPSSLSLDVDEEEQLTLVATLSDRKTEDVTEQAFWDSSEPEVATINEDGEIIGIAPGVTVISAKYAGKTSKLTVYVGGAELIRQLSISNRSVTLAEGEEEEVTATVYYRDQSKKDITDDAVWSSEDEEIATVENGVITGHAKGTTKLKVKYQGKSMTVFVKVTK